MTDVEDLPPGRIRVTLETGNSLVWYETDRAVLEDDRLVLNGATLLGVGNKNALEKLVIDTQVEKASGPTWEFGPALSNNREDSEPRLVLKSED